MQHSEAICSMSFSKRKQQKPQILQLGQVDSPLPGTAISDFGHPIRRHSCRRSPCLTIRDSRYGVILLPETFPQGRDRKRGNACRLLLSTSRDCFPSASYRTHITFRMLSRCPHHIPDQSIKHAIGIPLIPRRLRRKRKARNIHIHSDHPIASPSPNRRKSPMLFPFPPLKRQRTDIYAEPTRRPLRGMCTATT